MILLIVVFEDSLEGVKTEWVLIQFEVFMNGCRTMMCRGGGETGCLRGRFFEWGEKCEERRVVCDPSLFCVGGIGD